MREPLRETTPGSTLANFLYLLVGQAVYLSAGFLATMHIAQSLGPAGFGQISLGLALASYVHLLAQFGLPTWGARETAKTPGRAREYAQRVCCIRLSFWAVVSLIMVPVIWKFCGPALGRVFLLYALAHLPAALSLDWVFKGLGRTRVVGVSIGVQALLYLMMVSLLVRGVEDLLRVPLSLAVAGLIGSGILVERLRRMSPGGNHIPGPFLWRDVLKECWPLAGMGLLGLCIYNGDVLLVGWIKGEEAVGVYGSAYKIFYLFLAVLFQYFGAVFPLMSRIHAVSEMGFQSVLLRSVRHMIVWGMLVATAGTVLSRRVIAMVFGEAYIGAVPCVALLLWALFFIGINSALSQALTAAGKQKQCVKILLWQAIFVLTLNVPAILLWGAVGAAITTLAGEMMALMPYYRSHWHLLRWQPLRSLWVAALASFSLGLCLKLLPSIMGLPVSLLTGVGISGLVLWITKEVGVEDWLAMKRAWREMGPFSS